MKGFAELDAAIAVARRGSFRAAAVDLDMSTTALSHAVARLEGRLGVRLFNRTTRSVAPTEAGRALVARAAPALQELREAMEAARAQGAAPSGTLRINSAPGAAREMLDPLALEFLRRHPQMRLDIVTEGRLVDIVAEGFDLGVRPADLAPAEMIATPFGRPLRHAVVASPDYLAGRTPPRIPQDLLAHPCIRVRLPNGALYRWAFEKAGERLALEVDGPLTVDEAGLARRAALAGVGIGYLHAFEVEEALASGRLVRLLEDWTPELPGLRLYHPGRRNPSAGLRAFLDLARELAAGRAPGA
ncbi:LysR substrate-binding domain-containing protein [Albimonas pacifica]|uniref:Transcriptional regulator, LysR family n=1 Tax=Albimonas pacifica TaxID=1114924 RepID=A0A1I3J0P1_9RHOB|nr:LysR substrate-binding domain-containing protein [Albimonas pacifica]SFI53827.1 transcriptional regulator, LysR family [Albimonas pacifica]